MNFSSSAVIRGVLAPLLIVACFAAAGCASDGRPPRGGSGRGARNPVMPTLTGQEAFFAGRITAEVRIGAMAGFDRSGDGSGGKADGGRPRRGPGGGGFSMGGGMGGGPGGEGGRTRRPEGDEERSEPGPRLAMATQAPPVAIHLRFTNGGTVPADLQIVDFLSPLGNFVVTPSRLTLEPGQSLEVEPMASRLAGDATSGEISLALRLDGADETKTVTLQAEATPVAR